MRILFIMPEYRRKIWFFPHSFSYLSAYIKKHLPEVKIDFIDTNRHGSKDLYDALHKPGLKIVALTGLTSHYASIKKLLKQIKDENSSVITVVGGAIISSYPDFMIRHLGADYCVINEGEIAFLEFVKSISETNDARAIKSVGYLEDGKVVINPRQNLIENLDSLPRRDYETFDFKTYSSSGPNKNKGEIIGSRGCPFSCGFCYRLYGKRYRIHSCENVLEEIEYLIRNYKVYHIDFIDEIFFLAKKRVYEFCELKRRKNLRFTWNCALRVNQVDRELLQEMKNSGCLMISYGIEHGNQMMLSLMNKKAKVEQNLKALKLTREAGITPWANCIIGYPGETRETIKDMERMIDSTCATGSIHFVQALPGTALYSQVRQEGFINDEDEYFTHLLDEIGELPLDFTGLSKAFIEQEQRRIFSKMAKYGEEMSKKHKYAKFKYFLRTRNYPFFTAEIKNQISHFRDFFTRSAVR